MLSAPISRQISTNSTARANSRSSGMSLARNWMQSAPPAAHWLARARTSAGRLLVIITYSRTRLNFSTGSLNSTMSFSSVYASIAQPLDGVRDGPVLDLRHLRQRPQRLGQPLGGGGEAVLHASPAQAVPRPSAPRRHRPACPARPSACRYPAAPPRHKAHAAAPWPARSAPRSSARTGSTPPSRAAPRVPD